MRRPIAMAARSASRGRSVRVRRAAALLALLACAVAQDMDELPERVRAPAGGAVTLRAFPADPRLRYSWRRGGLKIDGRAGRLRLLAGGALQIVALRRDDAGAYSCAAEDDHAEAARDIELQVGDPVELAASIAGESGANVTGKLGRPLSIRCLAYGYPEPRTVWKRRRFGHLLFVSGEKYRASGNDLLIKALDNESLGEYACQADNGKSRAAMWTVVVRASNSASPPRPRTTSRPEPTEPSYTLSRVVELPKIPAASVDRENNITCKAFAHGCCAADGETPAHGPNDEGCCLINLFGCCPDNYKSAEGPHLEGCQCQYALFGCCPDNETIARGADKEGCACGHTKYGCCPDKHTAATGDNFEGCGCHTYQFGCCPDGVTVAKGPNLQGCDCRQSAHGCCGDGLTAAAGPDQEGCDCAASKYGCCPDGRTEAQGKKFSGCTGIPENKQAACSLQPERGPCRNYSIPGLWFFDMQYGGCSHFWYGGCKGNANRFASKKDCEDVCVRPSAKEVCQLPKVQGACAGSYPRWYFDAERGRCAQFVWSGCLGNANKFESRELCQSHCGPDRNKDIGTDLCKLPIERGSCAGAFSRWGFVASARRCEQFAWGGCEGNANRFGSEAACMLRCRPPGQLQPECKQPQEAGNCTDKQPAWSFSETENRCVPFYYSGCAGNGNRFADERSCAATCPSAFERDMCTLPADVGICDHYQVKWYFEKADQSCRQFYYGGCGGNGNNFHSEEECSSGCAGTQPTTTQRPQEPEPFRQDVYCQLLMSAGPCRASMPGWFYDAASDRCSQFAYGGCGGNGNNFQSEDECERRCRSGPAPAPSPSASRFLFNDFVPRSTYKHVSNL